MSASARCHDGARAHVGFTLIELLVVLVIIAALASIVAPSVFKNVSDTNAVAARAQLSIFELALSQFRNDVGRFPTTEEGLASLRALPGENAIGPTWHGPYVSKSIPLDPWGNAYVYQSFTTLDSSAYVIQTYGHDRREGGAGDDADIVVRFDATPDTTQRLTLGPASHD